MDIKLIAMDLDGTALQADHIHFSPRLDAALAEAHRRGIVILPITGRQFGALPLPLTCHPVWEDLVVTCNGGRICRLATGEELHSLLLTRQVMEQLTALSRQFDIPLEYCINSRLHLTQKALEQMQGLPQLTFHRDVILPRHGRFVETLDGLSGSEKAQLPHIPESCREAVCHALKAIDVSAVWSSASSMEITHAQATKAFGLHWVCRLKNIPREAVMALGDSGNDESMLRAAGLGIAMGNAPDAVKSWADAVTAANTEDGAAIAIERYALT